MCAVREMPRERRRIATYFHVVFTLPEGIAAIALQNKQHVYNIPFRTVSETLRAIAADPDRRR
jgi:hypothetical protein